MAMSCRLAIHPHLMHCVQGPANVIATSGQQVGGVGAGIVAVVVLLGGEMMWKRIRSLLQIGEHPASEGLL